jgi:nitrate reductase assembly molybdenum cofactor insertion protein NarJ
MKTKEQYQHLANLFKYPDEVYKENTRNCAAYIKENYSDNYADFEPFFEFVETSSIDTIEGVFSRTFHIQAICFLDLGYVLFAEDYKRGEFLVQMKSEQAKANVDCGTELADNLPNVLTLMSIMKDEDFLEEFAVRIMKKALAKMLEEFVVARMQLKDKVRMKKQKVVLEEDAQYKNIYQYAINGLLNVVNVDFTNDRFNDPVIVPTLGGNFLHSCTTSCSTPLETQKTA